MRNSFSFLFLLVFLTLFVIMILFNFCSKPFVVWFAYRRLQENARIHGPAIHWFGALDQQKNLVNTYGPSIRSYIILIIFQIRNPHGSQTHRANDRWIQK